MGAWPLCGVTPNHGLLSVHEVPSAGPGRAGAAGFAVRPQGGWDRHVRGVQLLGQSEVDPRGAGAAPWSLSLGAPRKRLGGHLSPEAGELLGAAHIGSLWGSTRLEGQRPAAAPDGTSAGRWGQGLTFSLLLAVQGASRTTKPLDGALDSSWAGGFRYSCSASLSTTSASCGHRRRQSAAGARHPSPSGPAAPAGLTYSSSRLRMWSMASSTFSGSPVTVTQLGSGAPLCGKRMSTWTQSTQSQGG